MNKHGLYACLLLPAAALANDSTGFVGTGGVQYLHNPHIAMESEDLYISKQQIRVAYRFRNLTERNITETVLFPMPRIDSYYDYDFADVAAFERSFRIWADGKPVVPQAHVRGWMYPSLPAGGLDYDKPVDMTDALKQCGLSDAELMTPFTRKHDSRRIMQKIIACENPALRQLHPQPNAENSIWSAQVIYSWQQTFAANSITTIRHQYTPLVGGSLYFDATPSPDNDFYRQYCIDDAFRRQMAHSKQQYLTHQALSYILTTGANWAQPIGTFTLTLERDAGELMSLCWDAPLRRIGPTRFQSVIHNFTPRQDLNIVFAPGIILPR